MTLQAPPVLDTAMVARARHLRQQSKRTLVEELEALSGMEPRLVVQALAQPFGMAVLETVDMLAFTPAFSASYKVELTSRTAGLAASDTEANDSTAAVLPSRRPSLAPGSSVSVARADSSCLDR